MIDPQDAFEREIKTMLAVNPSSDLHGRIRARAYATPLRRTRWFGLAFASATAMAVIVLVVFSMEPMQPQTARPSAELIVKTTTPPALPAEAPQPHRELTTAPPQQPRNAIHTVQARSAATATVLDSGKIELLPLTGFELAHSLEPIPQAPVLSIARLEPISIEPLSLTVQNLE